MKHIAVAALAVAFVANAGAQNLIITNARILDHDTNIARGSIVIENGRIVQIAFQGSPKASVDFRRVMLKRLHHTGSTLRSRSIPDKGTIATAVAMGAAIGSRSPMEMARSANASRIS